jgi:hypothetical protein
MAVRKVGVLSENGFPFKRPIQRKRAFLKAQKTPAFDNNKRFRPGK